MHCCGHHFAMFPVPFWLAFPDFGSFLQQAVDNFIGPQSCYIRNGVGPVDASGFVLGPALTSVLGPVVRTAPNKYDFNSAEAVKTIYSMTRIFPKSTYYEAFADPSHETALFNTRFPQQHAHLRRVQASLYSMSTVKTYEAAVDKQSAILLQKMNGFAQAGRSISLPHFLQYYAFDVIGEITVRDL